MSAVPELKQKKIARDQANAKAAKEAEAKASSEAAALTKTIYAKAQSYEQEYEKVGYMSFWRNETTSGSDITLSCGIGCV